MITRLAKKISHYFIEKEVINEQDYEIYVYSFELLISTLVNMVLIIVIALLSKKLTETVFYLLAFLPLRVIAGGYHADTHLRCILILFISYLIFLFALTFISLKLSVIISIASLIISTLIILIFAPVEDQNNPLSKEQKIKLKLKSRVTVFLMVVFTFCILIIDRYWALSLSLGCLSVGLAIIASKIKTHYTVNTTL